MLFRQDIGLDHPVFNGSSTDPHANIQEVDALIIGAGFSGVYLLHKLRDELGLSCRIFEAGSDLGGVWHWNSYPGARVDSRVPLYEYSIEKVWSDWVWSEKYPGFEELRKYFQHVDKVLKISEDVSFNTKVVDARFDVEKMRWKVNAENGQSASCRYFIVAAGFAAKRHFPDWKGLETFKGTVLHSSFWPKDLDFRKKRMAVIGTGCSGVQIVQECGPHAAAGSEITVFQRTPCTTLPMRQRKMIEEEQNTAKKDYPEIFKKRRTTFTGMLHNPLPKKTFEDSPEERETVYERRWEAGGLEFLSATYSDFLTDVKSNQEVYNFWARKTREMIHEPEKRDLLAPLEQPYPIGTKRPPLGDTYYEQFNNPYVKLVNIRKNPIVEVTNTGILTADGTLHEVDTVVLATGFDTHTGGMKNMGLKDIDGVDLSENWKSGTWSYLGMTCPGYPNMFFMYGAQAPTAFSTGPPCVEIQGDWIMNAIKKIEEQDIKWISPTRSASEEWRQKVKAISDLTLMSGTDSWYMGANIPGKPREQLNYLGGLPLYEQECNEALAGWKGFVVVR